MSTKCTYLSQIEIESKIRAVAIYSVICIFSKPQEDATNSRVETI